MKAIILDKTTGQIINYNYNVLNPDNPIVGLDPNLEVLLYYTPYEEPEYDARIYKLIETQSVTQTPHPDYPLYNQYLTTYAVEKRTNDELVLAVENAESLANESLIDTNKRLKLLALGLAACIRRLNGVNWGAREIAVTDEIVNKAILMYRNDEELQRKIDQITNNEEPNLDSGWESGE